MNSMTEYEIFNHYPPGFYFKESYWFAVFHPPRDAVEVQLVGTFTEWEKHPLNLSPLKSHKFWYLKLAPTQFPIPPSNGDPYKFRFHFENDNTWHWTQDPAARNLENTSFNANSLVTITDYQWRDQDWRRPGWEYYMIYQLHAKRFSNRNDLLPLNSVEAEVQPYIRELGATAIQLLPLNAFSMDDSWGYNGVFLYAIETSYGTPNDLKQLVDTCHQHGIAVILDVVLNHSGNRDNILWDIDREEYFSGDTDWGPMFNFESDVTRHFLIQNLLYLATEYHIDAFRFDMTHILHKGNQWVNHVRMPGRASGWNFIKELRHRIKAIDPGILLIAEELPDNWYVTDSYVHTSWEGDHHGPFDSQWSDAFHDNVKDVIKGAEVERLQQALTYLGDSWHDSLNYTESHDEVGNSNQRIAQVARDGKGWNSSQTAATITLLARGIPMLFMGQEGGEWMQFGQDGHAPDGGSWWNHRLNLNAYENDPRQRKILAWHQKMFAIRRAHQWVFAHGDIHIAHVHNDNGIIAFTRNNGQYLIVLNFKGKVFYDYALDVHGFYKEIANTSWPVFNIFDDQEASRGGDWHYPIHSVHIPAYGAVILEHY